MASPKITGRALIFIGALLMVLYMLAMPTRAWIQERRQISDLEAQIAAGQAAVNDLKVRKDRLTDPAYVQALARERLNYVFPGEVGFVVLDEETSTQVKSVPGAFVPNNNAAWYSKLWESTKLADATHHKNDPLVVKSKK